MTPKSPLSHGAVIAVAEGVILVASFVIQVAKFWSKNYSAFR